MTPFRPTIACGLTLVCLILMHASVFAQPANPALAVSTKRALDTYLRTGPQAKEIGDGSSSANWGILRKIGIPDLLDQAPLQVGDWDTVWAPVNTELEKRGFSSLDPLEALTWVEETRKEPARFLRLLASRGLIDARVPKDRQRGEALRESLLSISRKLGEVRANVRFERSGWSFTGTASLVPSQRVVRIALSGSQPCADTGRARTANLAIKGRLFLDKSVPEGIKVQILEDVFSSTGCEETIKGRIAQMVEISLGGEARVSGNLIIDVKDDVLTGRLQLDIAYRPEGDSLQTGHGTYSLRGSLRRDGTAHATLTPVSTSGSRGLREALAKAGSMEGQISMGQGAGGILMPLFRGSLGWRASK